MQKKTKILLAVAVVLLVLLGLFASRSYLLNKFGITADIVTTEKLLNTRNVYNYYLGADGTAKATGSTASLTQTDNDVSKTAPGIKVKRGNGWVYIELG